MALPVLLLALPLVFSFGTNGRVLAHSLAAASFAITAVAIGLLHLFQGGLITKTAYMASLAVLCVPPLVQQARIALDVEHTYRQLAALGEQASAVPLGSLGNRLLVDKGTQTSLENLLDAGRRVGLVPGQVIQDFTGDGSGLIYAFGGRPLAMAWMGGGYPGSEAAAVRVLSQVPPSALRSAWLLTSDTNPRAIPHWQRKVDALAGPGAHERVATVRILAPYRWRKDAPEFIDVQIWKPRLSVARDALQ